MDSFAPMLATAWSFVSDFLIVIVVFAALFAFFKYAGKSGFVTLIASMYIGYGFYSLFPYAGNLPTSPALAAFFAAFGLYFIFVLLAYFALKRSIGSDYGPQNLLMLLAVCLLTTGFVIALLYHLFPLRALYPLTPFLSGVLGSKGYFFGWFFVPILGLFLLRR